jgi:hypothetical protein
MFVIRLNPNLIPKPEAYVESLANTVPQEALSESNTKIVVIGCGKWEAIESYAGASSTESSQCVSYTRVGSFRVYRIYRPILCRLYPRAISRPGHDAGDTSWDTKRR